MNMKKRIITPHTPSRARSFVPKPTSEARSFSNFPLGNKKAANFGIALLVIGLIITATAAVFYFSGEKKDQVYSGTVTPIKIPVNYAVPAEYNLEFTIKPCSRTIELKVMNSKTG